MAIILLGILTLFLGVLVAIRIFRFISRKVKGKTIRTAREFSFIIFLFLAMIASTLSVFYFVGKEVVHQAPKAVALGKEAISNTVAFGTEAVFEGVGRTADHFNQKWEKEYQNRLNNITIEISAMDRKPMDAKKDSIFIEAILSNSNSIEDRVALNTLASQNYLLIGDSSELFYPVQIVAENDIQFVPKGKSSFKFITVMPEGTEPRYFRLLDKIQTIQ